MQGQTYKLGFVGLVLMGWLAGLAVAGPLDRSSDGPRNNPAVDDMMRIPGVLNMDYEEAMDLLQEAGLNPRLKAIKRVVPRYEGREGKVVFQSPLPGGMAMLGSSVAITYYLPEGFESDLPEEEDADYAEEGMGDEESAGESADEELTAEREFPGKDKKIKIKGPRIKVPKVKIPQTEISRRPGPKVKIPRTEISGTKTPKVKLPKTKGMKAIPLPKSQGMKIMPKAQGTQSIVPPKTKGMKAIVGPISQGMKIMPKAQGTQSILPPAAPGR